MTRHAFGFVPALLLAGLLPGQEITWWTKGLDEALAATKASASELLLLYCWQDGHEACQSMFAGTLSDKKTAKALTDFVCMGAKNDDAGKPVLTRYGITSVPTVLFLDPSGALVDVVAGYVPVDRFVVDLERIRAGKDTIASLRQQVAAAPTDMPLHLRLVQKLRSAGDRKGSLVVIDAMIKHDPDGKTEAVAEALLLKITEETFADGIEPKDYDLGPLRRFLNKQRNKRIQFVGYDTMATALWRQDELKESAAAAHKAWKNIPDDQIVDWGQRMTSLVYRNWKELDKADKGVLKLALGISKKTLAVIEKQHKKEPDKPFYANALYLHASMLLINKKRKQALTMMDDAIEIDPDNENLKKARDHWLSGNK